jgi:hypothetical protein
MKTVRRIATCLIVAVLVVGCDANAPTEQSGDVIGSPAFSASQDWIRAQFWNDQTFYVDCLGEDVRFYGWVPYQWHIVTSASGVYNFHLMIRPVTPNRPGIYGETASGKLYIFKYGGVFTYSFHSGPNESYTWLDKETYVAENGDRLSMEVGYLYTINANGDLTVERWTPYQFSCKSN